MSNKSAEISEPQSNDNDVRVPSVRQRRPWLHKRNVRKKLVEQGKERISLKIKGKVIPARNFIPQNNCCSYGCYAKIDVSDQQMIHENFYQMSSSSKTLFLRSCLQRKKTVKQISKIMPIAPLHEKKFSYEYNLKDGAGVSHRVCKIFFTTCLRISAQKAYYAVKNEEINPTAEEMRGRRPPANKTPEELVNLAKSFLESIPSYETHFGRTTTSKRYLGPDVTFTQIHREYSAIMESLGKKPVSKTILKDIYTRDFNFSIKTRHADTCKTCNAFKLSIAALQKDDEKRQAEETKKDNHHGIVSKVNGDFVNDLKRASDEVKVLTFDLQEGLPTPKIPANISFCKRTLWTYNLCIYDEDEKQGHMYLWSEDTASRGPEEIASCLLHYLEKLPSTVTEVVLYSDSCSGQNRNITVSLMLKHFLSRSPNVQKITQKFLVSGHSFNSCTRNFGLIEKESRKHKIIATLDEWASVIEKSKRSIPVFKVTQMKTTDFLSFTELQGMICNWKKDVGKNKVSWIKMWQIEYLKNDIFKLYVTNYDGEKIEIDVQKTGKTADGFMNHNPSLLYPNGREISEAKMKDLMDLMPLIAEECQENYKKLKTCSDDNDFVYASCEED